MNLAETIKAAQEEAEGYLHESGNKHFELGNVNRIITYTAEAAYEAGREEAYLKGYKAGHENGHAEGYADAS